MKIYIISDYMHLNPVKDALDSLALQLHLEVHQADYLNVEQEIVPQIVTAMTEADLIVADISNEKPNLYYEVGVAHGLNKPVIIVSQIDNFSHFSLLTSRFYKYDIGPNGVKKMAFFFKDILSNETVINKLRPALVNAAIAHIPPASSNNKSTLFLGGGGVLFDSALESGLYTLLKEIPGFDVQRDETMRNKEYDFILWNSNEDPDLQRLGNPIPIEVKGSQVHSAKIRALAFKAYTQGFTSFILFTLARRNNRINRLIASLKKEGGISVLVIYADDLEKVVTPADLFNAIKKALREFFLS